MSNEITCPKCKGYKQIVVLHDYYDEKYGLIKTCDLCGGNGTIIDPEWVIGSIWMNNIHGNGND
jgi:DnaJ-class molecular chaperone